MDVDDEPIPGLGADGRPDPGYARRLRLVPAPAGRRAAAFALDALVWIVLALPGAIGVAMIAGAIASSGGDAAAVTPATLAVPLVLVAVSQGLLVVFGTVQLALHGRTGVTLGKSSFGIRSVNVARFGPAGFWRVVLRALVLWAGQLVLPFVGPALLFASSAWDPERRGRSWLDRVGRCYAIDVRHGLNPLDSRALRHARRAMEAPQAVAVARAPSLASDRSPGEDLFIPSARSSSGVVSSVPVEAGAWMPPELVPGPGPGSPGTASAAVALVAASAPSSEPQRSAQDAAPAAVLVFDDGTRVPASGRVLLGRSPAPAPGEASAQLVPLVDESMRISKTHAAFGIDDTGCWVADRSSKNGTVLHAPDGSSHRLDPGVRTPVATGARVVLGGRSFTVTVAPGR
jgi:uncharacterized RDD family membrane protein YckC